VSGLDSETAIGRCLAVRIRGHQVGIAVLRRNSGDANKQSSVEGLELVDLQT